MASIKKKSSGGGGANWMDTYGDMVTLLLCFFVLLYSISTIDEQKWMIVVQSFNKNALVSTDETPKGPQGEGEDDLGDGMPALQEEENPIDELYEFLATYAESMSSTSGEEGSTVSVSKGDGYIYLSFNNSIFFSGDHYNLLPAGQEILNGILPALDEAAPYIDEIVVSGHTATAQGQYSLRKDLTLSSNRANEVVIYLLENSNALDPARVLPRAYGQWRPVAPNEEESDRAKNRRVEMIITGVDLEGNLPDSIQEYYETINQTQPEGSIPQYTTSAG